MRDWHYYDKSEFDTLLYDVPHDTLIVLGAYGHGVIKDLLFGSKMEKIQSTVTNNLLITGPVLQGHRLSVIAEHLVYGGCPQ